MRNLVSICIPVFNGSKYLEGALDSAIKQTYRPLEIIISDDLSKDNSLEIATSYITKTKIPIHIYKHSPSGIAANWNSCIEKSKGEYLKFLFQDDLMKPDCIEKMMELVTSYRSVGLVCCKRNIIKSGTLSQRVINKWLSQFGSLHSHWSIPLAMVNSGEQLLKDKKLLIPPVNKIGEPSCVLIKKSSIYRAGLFDNELKQSLDYEAWFRMLKNCDLGFIDQSLVSFRLHKEQATQKNNRDDLDEKKLFRRKLLEHLSGHLNSRLKYKLSLEINFPRLHRALMYLLQYRF